MTPPTPDLVERIADERCGYAVVDRDGIQEPCDRPATGHRWYQDVEHEDCLDVACDWHQNEGGRRMAALMRDEAGIKAEALREAADEVDSEGHHWSGASAHAFFRFADKLRDRADALSGDESHAGDSDRADAKSAADGRTERLEGS